MRKMAPCILVVMIFVLSCLGGASGESLTGTEGIVIPDITLNERYDIPDNEAMAFLRSLKMGWNLGNTFDAYDDGGWAKGLNLETAWTGAKTTRKLIEAVHAAGFETIRMPVSWHNHVDQNDRIDPDWLARVREVADWALQEGMYVIVNVHHDNQEGFLYPDRAHMERTTQYMTSVWKQMAEAFKDCNDHLILESMNEPRLTGTTYEWYWGPAIPQCKEAAACINELNQLFVDIVRASGGNNATRYLCVPAYDANPEYAYSEQFRLPKDSAENRLIVAAHAYTPYSFALDRTSKDSSFTLSDTGKQKDIRSFMNKLYQRFIKYGIPVILDEFGALDKNGNLQDRVNFAAFYVASATLRGIPCCWWDNHAFTGDGERFGLINRKTIQWVYPDIVLAIRSNCLGRETD